jgi:hypothetical protein
MTPLQAFAYSANWSFFSDVKKGWHDFLETIVTEPQKKQELVLKNMAEWQKEKEQLLATNQPVPMELEVTIREKQSKLESISTPSTNGLATIVDTILVAKELGKIQSYVAQFHKLKTEEIPQDQRQQMIQSLESDVNQLEIVRKHCIPISVNSLLAVNDAYETLKTSYCKVLEGVPRQTVQNTLVG